MKKIILLMCCVVSINAYSQITVTGTNMVNIGDIIYQSVDDITQINIGQTGQGQTWDFSQLMSNNTEDFSVLDPANTPYYNDYPNSDICINSGTDFLYATKDMSGIHLLGSGDSIFQSPLLVVPFPLFFGATYTAGPTTILDSLISGSILNVLLPAWFGTSIDTIAFFLTNGQAHRPDTLNILFETTQYFSVDADGSIILPMGTYDCVRLRQEMLSSNSVSIYFTDTLTGSNSGWYSLGPPTTEMDVTYNWFSNDPATKFSLLEVVLDSLGNQDGGITFLDAAPSANNNILSSDLFEVYPVPTNDKIFIKTNLEDIINISLFDVSGKELSTSFFTKEVDLDLSEYDKGIYFLQIQKDNGSLIKKVIIE
tara:strand:+ start:1013 stop:2116 length:1104 start_codon:yes stop_codon:yes gene_type:complete